MFLVMSTLGVGYVCVRVVLCVCVQSCVLKVSANLRLQQSVCVCTDPVVICIIIMYVVMKLCINIEDSMFLQMYVSVTMRLSNTIYLESIIMCVCVCVKMYHFFVNNNV
jgi:hypothetical protein